ncbi:ATP-dependent DNA helicase [Trichonephila clavipes]|nr:ATP-dependent DNA helicase [Trichonephila clavipes]
MCYSSGKVSLPLLGEPEEPLKTLLLSVTNESKEFLSKIRKYNSCFQMTSFRVDKVIRMPRFSPTFTVQGQIYHQIGSLFPEDNYKVVIHADRTPLGEHERRYNAPMVNEVAVLVTDEPCSPRDIVLRAHDNTLQRIADTHKFCDALQYPLIFSKGEPGYFNIPVVNPTTEQPIPNTYKATFPPILGRYVY